MTQGRRLVAVALGLTALFGTACQPATQHKENAQTFKVGLDTCTVTGIVDRNGSTATATSVVTGPSACANSSTQVMVEFDGLSATCSSGDKLTYSPPQGQRASCTSGANGPSDSVGASPVSNVTRSYHGAANPGCSCTTGFELRF